MGARALIFLALAGCGSVLSQTRPPPLAATHAEPVVPARARYHYLVARLAIEEERWPEAEAALRTALLHDPDSPWIWLSLADVARGDGEEVEERRRVQEAVRFGPELHQTWSRLGRVSEAAGDTRTAIDAYREATDRGAGSEAWLPLCRMLVRREDPLAAAAVRAWRATKVTDPEDLRERGRLLVKVGELAAAVPDLGEALIHDPTDARLLDELLTAVTGSGLYRQGLSRLAIVHQLVPRDTDVLLRSYHLAATAGDHVRAAEALEALDLLLGGHESQVKLWLADAYSALGRHAEARAELEAGARTAPPIADLPFHRARILRAEGRPAEALKALQVPAKGANRPDAVALQARLFIDVGRAAQARDVLTTALLTLPDDYVILGALVSAHVALGDREAMLATIDRMAMLDPEARARTRARSLAGMGDMEGALAALRATGPTQAESWVVGGILLREGGDATAAIDWLSRGVDRFPKHAALRAELGLARSAADQEEDALLAMREALAVDPAEPRAARFFAGAIGPDGTPERQKQARDFVLAALERQPADAGLLTALGEVEYRLHQPLQAVEAWEEACRYQRPDATLVQHLARAYRDVGRPEQAQALEARFPR